MSDSTSNQKIDGFLKKLSLMNHKVEYVSSRPKIYSIDGKLMNVRSTINVREDRNGVQNFWYDVSENVLDRVDYLVYLTTTSDFFVLIPSEFMNRNFQFMYISNSNEYARSFMIDWDSCDMVMKDKRVNVIQFYQDLIHEEDFPEF